MRFLDANVFIYAYYKPKRELTEKEKQMKEHAKDTITRINEGEEEVTTTVVHLSEVTNILKRALSMEDLYSLLIGLFSMDNVRIVDATTEDYIGAIELMSELKMDPNDCLAVDVMRCEDINEIYTFDRGFDGVAGIIRVP